MQSSQPFRRFNSHMAAISSAMMLAAGSLRDYALSNVGMYESRGKGKGTLPSPRFITARGKEYPRSSTRQHDRHAASQRMVVVNGFQLMQTLPSRLRSPK